MSIELSSTASSPKVGVGADKSKIKSSDDTNPDGGGFSEILTSLDSPDDQSEVAGKQAESEEKRKRSEGSACDTAVPATPVVPTEIAMLLAQAGEVTSDKLKASLTSSTSNVPTEMAMLLAQAGEMSGSQLNAPAEGGRLLGPTGSMRLTANAQSAEKLEVASGRGVALGGEKTEDFKQSNAALLDQSASALLGQARKTRVAELQSAAAASLVEARALKQSSMADAVARETDLSGALLSSGVGEDVFRQIDRAGSKSLVQTTVSGLEGVWGAQTFQVGNHVDAPSVIADVPMLSPEQAVADTVSYWVTQGVQNAELKLDGFDGEPIAVSISLKGDEAQINFRTDQPEVQKILEGAVAHLKALLSSEGLVLTGVSVGGSGQQGAGAQEQRNRPDDVRQATILMSNERQTESQVRVNKPVGRALDLYV